MRPGMMKALSSRVQAITGKRGATPTPTPRRRNPITAVSGVSNATEKVRSLLSNNAGTAAPGMKKGGAVKKKAVSDMAGRALKRKTADAKGRAMKKGK